MVQRNRSAFLREAGWSDMEGEEVEATACNNIANNVSACSASLYPETKTPPAPYYPSSSPEQIPAGLLLFTRDNSSYAPRSHKYETHYKSSKHCPSLDERKRIQGSVTYKGGPLQPSGDVSGSGPGSIVCCTSVPGGPPACTRQVSWR